MIPRSHLKNWRWWVALPIQLPIVGLHVAMEGINFVLEWVHSAVWAWVSGSRMH